jgi:soluble lytic murein transglycosylase
MLKTLLTVVILAAALAAGAIALFWQALLTPEQKLKYGFYASAVDDFRARLAAHPDNPTLATDYVDSLVLEGNFGRALYLADIYGVQSAKLDAIRPALEECYRRGAQGEAYALHDGQAVQELRDYPAYQVLRYLEGYRYALAGDWHSAMNQFAAVESKRLPSVLRPYQTYYLARAYRLSGGKEEKAKVEELLKGLVQGKDSPAALKDMARNNLVAWYLSADYPGSDGLNRAKITLDSIEAAAAPWVEQKARTEFAEYYLAQKKHDDAWAQAQLALLIDPTGQAGKAAGEQVIAVLQAILADKPAGLVSENGALLVKLAPGVFDALAASSVQHSYTKEAAALLNQLKPHLTDRARWEELRTGLSVCYRAAGNASALYGTMEEANLGGLSNHAMAGIYYNYALLCEQREQWTEALRYYGYLSQLGGGRAGDAHFRSYAVLKHVQDPLDLAAASSHLQACIKAGTGGEFYGKAVEELLPLLIWQGSTAAARRLIDAVLARELPEDASPAAVAESEQLAGVANYWRAYLADKADDSNTAQRARAAIPLKYWDYYEISAHYPPEPKYLPAPECLRQPESAGEYFAGLGLADTATEYFTTAGDADNQLGLYLALSYSGLLKQLTGQQYAATGLLESGRVREQALLDWVLAEAYPRPYSAEVAAAAAESGVDENLIYAIIKKESNFKEDTVSWAGAKGLMQVMPATASWLVDMYHLNISPSQLMQPAANIRFGAANLRSLSEQLGGDTQAVIHAYNGGAGNYQKWSARYGANPVLLTELVPNEENEGFGKRVSRYYKMYTWLQDRAASSPAAP